MLYKLEVTLKALFSCEKYKFPFIFFNSGTETNNLWNKLTRLCGKVLEVPLITSQSAISRSIDCRANR